jgi:hypothetical protein
MSDDQKPYASIRVVQRHGVLTVLDARSRPIEGIIAVDMALRPGRPPIMRLNMAAGAFEIEGVPSFAIMDPGTKTLRQVKRIEFADDGPPFEAPDIIAAPPPGPAPVPAGSVEVSAEQAAEIQRLARQVSGHDNSEPNYEHGHDTP